MTDGEQEILDDLVEEYLTQCRRGEQPDTTDFCLRHPNLAGEIREILPAVLFMERARNTAHGTQGAGTRPHSAAETSIPSQIGDFRIVREIGRGGMGIVYEAEQGSLGRRVALKVLPPGTAGNALQFQRFEREARAAAKLHHTNIVPVIGVGNEDGVHYLVLQLIDGCGLDEVISELRRLQRTKRELDRPTDLPLTDLPPTEDAPASEPRRRLSRVQTITAKLLDGACVAAIAPSPSETRKQSSTTRRAANVRWWQTVARIGVQVAEALHYAASQSILHRDIKPANLMVDREATVWVTDFGLAKSAESGTLTMSGEFVGTLRYIPPERLKGDADLRGDVYALGATLYELATLTAPFQETDSARLVRLIAEVEPAQPRSINPEIPRDLETIIMKAMAKVSGERYQTAAELAEDLRNFLEDRSIVARRSTLTERFARWCRRNPLLALLNLTVLSLLLVIAVGATFAAIRLRERERFALNAEREAVQSESQRRRELFRVNVARANETSGTGGPGQRLEGLEAIREAMEAVPTDELSADDRLNLTNAAIRCLARADVREIQRLPKGLVYIGEPVVDFARQQIAYSTLRDRGTILQSLADGTKKRILLPNPAEPPQQQLFALARGFNREGNRLFELFAGNEVYASETVRVWDCDSGKLLLNWAPQNLARNALAFHPDNRHLLIAAGDGTLRLFDLETGQQVRESPKRLGPMIPRYNRDGSLLALAPFFTSTIQIVDPTTLETVAALPDVHGGAIDWLPGKPALVAGTATGQVYVWDHANRTGRFLKEDRADHVVSIACWNGDRYLAVRRTSRTEIRRIAGDERLLTLEGIPVGLSKDSRRFAMLDNNSLAVHEFIEPQSCRRIIGSATAAEFSPNGRLLGVSGKSGVQIYDADTLALLCDLGLDHCGPVAFAPSGKELVTFGLFSHAMRWPLAEIAGGRIGPPQRVVPGRLARPGRGLLAPQHQGRHAHFGHDGASLFLADYRNHAVLSSDAPYAKIRRFAELVNAAQVAVSPDGRWVAASSFHHETVRVWEAANGKLAFEVSGRVGAAFTPDNKHLVTQSDRNIELYEVGSWSMSRELELAAGPVSRTAFHLQFAVQPQGKFLAVADSTEKVRLFDYDRGTLAATLTHQQPGSATWMAFSRDGSRLSVTRENLDVSVWDLEILQRELAGLGLPTELCQSTLPSAPAASPASLPPVSLPVDRGDLPKPAEWHGYSKVLALNEAVQAHWADAALDITSSLEQLPEGDVVVRSQLLALRGEYHFRDQDPWTARDDLEKALQLDPGSKKAARLLARIHAFGPKEIRDPKRVSAMVALMNVAAGPDPMTPVLLGFASIRLGQYPQGQKMLESVTESVPGDQQRKAFAAFGLALAAHRQGNDERAAKAIESAKVLYGQFHSQLSGSERAEFERLKSEVDAELKSPAVAP